MARSPVLLDTSSRRFAFQSKQTGAAALNSNTSSGQDKVPQPPLPSWVENLWPLPTNRLSAIVNNDIGLPIVDPADLTNYIQNGARVIVVNIGILSSYLIINELGWRVLSQGLWFDLHTPTVAEDPYVYSLKDRSYIHEPSIAVYEFDPANVPPAEFEGLIALVLDFTNTGITILDTVSSCAALNYRILATTDKVYWSAPENDLSFDPDLGGINDGAGNASPLGVTGPILFVTGTEEGFYIYTTNNIIRAKYSQNPANPWRFTPVNASTGVLSINHVFVQNILSDTFIWSSTGFSQLRASGQTQVAGELTELLAGDVLERYDPATRNVITVATGVTFELQLVYAGKRTICISYGQEGQIREYIAIFDTTTEQWSRIKIAHIAILDVIRINTGGRIFDDWLETFDDTVDTFADFIAIDVNPQFRTNSIGVLDVNGKIVRLTPIDVYTGVVGSDDELYEVMSNRLVYPNLKLTRRSINELNELILYNSFPSYPDDTNPNKEVTNQNTAIYAYSDLDKSPVQYLPRGSLIDGDVEVSEFVETVSGNNITIALEDINSITGIEAIFKPAGRKWQ